jgi:Plasmid pRiA4b ORF-3-like protein
MCSPSSIIDIEKQLIGDRHHEETMPAKSIAIYQLKITLQGSKPPIWRRVLVKSNITLEVFHDIIQAAMGWTNSHLHHFYVHGNFYSNPKFDLEDTKDESQIKLSKILTMPKDKFSYEYDFGDGWDHQIVLEKILPIEPETQYPRCLTGKRNCPPEDIGGIWGYQMFLTALHDKKHSEHQDAIEKLAWIGGEFDPEEFDLTEINAELVNLD